MWREGFFFFDYSHAALLAFTRLESAGLASVSASSMHSACDVMSESEFLFSLALCLARLFSFGSWEDAMRPDAARIYTPC